MSGNNNDLEKRLWAAADQLWANTSLRPSEYSGPVLGLIFLRFADSRFEQAKLEIEQKQKASARPREIKKLDYEARGILYIPEPARFSKIKQLPEGSDFGKILDDAMKAIEAENLELKDNLPKNYSMIDNRTIIELLRILGSIPMDIEGDVFGKIYEYFLGNLSSVKTGVVQPIDFRIDSKIPVIAAKLSDTILFRVFELSGVGPPLDSDLANRSLNR